MINRIPVLSAIISSAVIFVSLATDFTEARLGNDPGRGLLPSKFTSSSASEVRDADLQAGNSLDLRQQEINRHEEVPINEGVAVPNENEGCDVPCSDGSGRITVCHPRAGGFVQICTERESFDDHKAKGDVCGLCISADM